MKVGNQTEAHNQVVSAVRQYLEWSHCWTLKVHGGAYQRAGIPDILACWPPSGRLIAVEVKTGQARLTTKQADELAGLEAAGAVCIVAETVDDVEEVLIKLELIPEPLVVSREQAMAWRLEERAAHRGGFHREGQGGPPAPSDAP